MERSEKRKHPAAVLLPLLLILAMVLAAGPAQAKTGISIKAGSASAGDTFTVKVVFSGDSPGHVRGMLEYDNSAISYISGGQSEGDNGIVELEGGGEGGDIVFSLKFRALKAGDTGLTIRDAEMYNIDEDYEGTVSGSYTVTVNESAADEGSQEEEPSVDEDSSASDGTDSAAAPEEEQVQQPADEDISAEEEEQPAMLPVVLVIAAAAAAVIAAAVIVRRRRHHR